MNERLREYFEQARLEFHAWLAGSDSDGSPKGRDAKRLDGEAATARAEGIAQQPHPKV